MPGDVACCSFAKNPKGAGAAVPARTCGVALFEFSRGLHTDLKFRNCSVRLRWIGLIVLIVGVNLILW
ncbi:hypothetical protein [Paenibacillus wulumuqiensis]|uniref:hypothetical protein n=1 Tax=Paenibacillus wulumuqiensis TaxID=1567107 RepID=UPI000619900C|nr:hypothetical protein [Paenibacillus wulumuqiensis]